MIGTRIGDRYLIEAPLGAGGMGAVYRATDERLGRPVAVKLLLPELGGDTEAIARFEREARATARLTHPGIVQIHDFGVTPAPSGRGMASYLVMELAEGLTLARAIDRAPLPLNETIAIGLEVLSALASAHAAGVVHRDLKPENVMISRGPDGQARAKLLDFGLAQIKSGTAYARLTQTGAILGTPRYMSPEQARGEPCDARTDVYAVGLVLHAALAGRAPFDSESIAGIVAQVLDASPPRLDTFVPGVPPAVAAAIDTAIQKRPEKRFASAQAFASALEQARAATASVTSPAAYASTALAPAVTLAEVASAPRSSGRGLVLALAASLVLVVALALALAFVELEPRGQTVTPPLASSAPPPPASASPPPPTSVALAVPVTTSVAAPPRSAPFASRVPPPPPSSAPPPPSLAVVPPATTAPVATAVPPPSTTTSASAVHLIPECALAVHCCVRVGAPEDQCVHSAIGGDPPGSATVCPIVIHSYHDVLVQMGRDASECVWPAR